MFRQICSGIQQLHKRNPPLVHNDIKPGNILLANDNKPILIDFGSVSKARHTITNRKEALYLQEQADAQCTLGYRAPELFNVDIDTVIDERTDVWSLGCTLFTMAFLAPPFETDEMNGSVALAAKNGATLPQDADTRFSKPFCQLILWTLNPDHKKRPFVKEVIDRTTQVLRADEVTLDIK